MVVKLTTVFVACTCFINGATAQTQGRYHSLSEALKEPEKVVELYLVKQGLFVLPKEIGQFKNLESLVAEHNRISYLPPELLQLEKLKTLDLAHNELRTLPRDIYKLTRLEKFRVEKNFIERLPEDRKSVV